MHQTKKGNQWHFGMKAHIGVDAESGLVHTVIGTAANVNDVTQAGALLHGQEDCRLRRRRLPAAWTSARGCRSGLVRGHAPGTRRKL
jgi:IS5 family transposase